MENLSRKVEFKGKQISYGRYLFNKCLPEDFRVIDEPIGKKKLRSLLNEIVIKYPSDVVIETLDKIKTLGFNLSTIEGHTLTIKDLYREDLEEVANNLTGDPEKDMPVINSPEVMQKLKTLPFAEFIESGARGSWTQAKQLVLCRGYVADSSNKIRGDLIRSSLAHGLTQDEFFNSSWGSRKGLLDTAISTGQSGYLCRQLVYSLVDYVLGSKDDCGTTATVKITVKSEDMARMLLGRYMVEDEQLVVITRSNFMSLIGKEINLRSPIYCQSKKICKVCYGNLYKILHTDQIGIIAAQGIGERLTQLVLRTFHTSGVAQGSKGKNDNDDIISGMAFANKLFHSPGKVVQYPEMLLEHLYDIFSQYGSIHMVHYELIVSTMMWVGETRWRLHKNRETKEYEWVSILQIPSRVSWLIAFAFANIKTKLIDALINEKYDDKTSISELFRL